MDDRGAMAEKTPIYHRIYEELRDQIVDGVYPLGSRIPSETELVSRYGVSRITVRRAISELVAEGFLYTEQGRGSFVRKNRLWGESIRSSVTKSFSDICAQAGFKPGARDVSKEIIRAPLHYARALEIPDESLLICVRRIRTADDWPIMDEYTYFPFERFKPVLSMDLTDASIFAVTEEVGGMRPLQARDSVIDAVIATPDQSRELNISPGAALLKRSATYMGADGRPVSLGRSFFIGGRFSFEV